MKAIKPLKYDEIMRFTDGSYVEASHSPDWCEHNYADWSSLDDTDFYDRDFDDIIIGKYDYGFHINGYPINCYSEQNGYYSNDLDVELFDTQGKKIEYLNIICD